MQNKKGKLLSALIWFIPSGTEAVVYILLTALTAVASNMGFLRDFIFLPNNFSFTESVLNSFNDLLQQFVGDDVTRTGVVAVFWALVGLGVYVLIWLGMNFSNELGNDLAITKYVHPRGVDTSSPLRDFISRTVFRAFVFFILVFYLQALIVVLLPYFGSLFNQGIQAWFSAEALRNIIFAFIMQLVSLHIFTILVRLLLIRKRVFG